MINNKEKNVRTTNFLGYLENQNKFSISLYQRNFVWKSEEIEGFVDETINKFLHRKSESDKSNKIFCGTIYIRKLCIDKDNFKWEIIDGQQRTTFLFLFSKVVNEYVDKYIKLLEEELDKKSTTKKHDHKKLKEIKEYSSFSIEIKRKNNSLEKLIDSNSKEKKYYNEYNNLKKYIKKTFSDDLKDNPEDIYQYIIYFFTKVELIEIKISDDEYDINDVFKSINSKNKHLSQWDIVRNEVYRTLDATNNEKRLTMLKELEKNLEKIKENLYIEKEEFIRSYIISKEKKYIFKGRLSKEYEILTKKSKDTSGKFCLYVERFLEEYEKIGDKSLKDTKYNNNIKWYFLILKEMKTTQIKIFTLSMMFSWNGKNILVNEIDKTIKKILFNFIVYVNINNGRGNEFEKFFKVNIKEILSSSEKANNSMLNSLFFKENERNFDNEKRMLSNIKKKKELIKLYIWIMTPNSEKGILHYLYDHYEHVLPKNFEKHWIHDKNWENLDKKKIKEDYLEKIGNILLLNKKSNSSISNKSFSDKKESYFKNEKYYISTKNIIMENELKFLKFIFDIEGIKEWTPEIINKRTNDFSEEIFKQLYKLLFEDNDIYSELMINERITKMENASLNKEKYNIKNTNDKNDIFLEIKDFLLKKNEWASLSEIYEHMLEIFENNLKEKRWENKENFKSVIRRTIQNHTFGMKASIKNSECFEKRVGIKSVYRYKK